MLAQVWYASTELGVKLHVDEMFPGQLQDRLANAAEIARNVIIVERIERLPAVAARFELRAINPVHPRLSWLHRRMGRIVLEHELDGARRWET